MRYLEDKIYMAGVVVLLGCELFMSIPLMTDSMARDGSSFFALVAIGHFFAWLFGKSGMVENPMGFAHLFGILGFIVSLLPAIGFIWHIFVVILLIRYVLGMVKMERQEKKRNQDREDADGVTK